jgi:hypothetical protein
MRAVAAQTTLDYTKFAVTPADIKGFETLFPSDEIERLPENVSESGNSADRRGDGATFDGFTRCDGVPVKDLNDLSLLSADDYEAHREFIENLMFFNY